MGNKLEWVIEGITNDKYELPIIQFDSYKEMAQKLNRTIEHCHSIVSKQNVFREWNCRFIKILLEEEKTNGNVY